MVYSGDKLGTESWSLSPRVAHYIPLNTNGRIAAVSLSRLIVFYGILFAFYSGYKHIYTTIMKKILAK